MNTAQRNEISTSSKTGLTYIYTTHMHANGSHNGANLFVYDALLQMADCNHNTRASQTVSADSHAMPAYKG